ncbi:MAG: STAS-like domain-containing protein [Pseudomonadota bacterium]
MIKISIAQDFSIYPGGRTANDGPYSGAEFRDTYLIPALIKNEKVEVNLDGTCGYGSSFLEEAFGGLIRSGITSQQLKLLKCKSSRKSILLEIKSYIQVAMKQT